MQLRSPLRCWACWSILLLAAPGVAGVPVEKAEHGSPLPELSLERYEEIRRGEILVFEEMFRTEDGKDAGRGKAYAYFAHPWSTIWAILTDYDEQQEYMPRVATSEVVKREGSRVWVKFEMEVLWVDLAWVIQQTEDEEAHEIRFLLDHSYQDVNSIDDTQGSWEFIPVEDGKATVVVYRVFVDTGYAVPDFILSYLTRKDLPDVLGNLRRRVRSGGKWRKSD